MYSVFQKYITTTDCVFIARIVFFVRRTYGKSKLCVERGNLVASFIETKFDQYTKSVSYFMNAEWCSLT